MNQKFTEILRGSLEFLSQRIIDKFQPDVIAITGSVGKTSAKEAIYAVLADSGTLRGLYNNRPIARRSKGNLNTELGASLAIINDWKESSLKLVSRGQPAGTRKFAKLLFWLRVISAAKFKIAFGKIKNYPKFLVLEYGADRPGDIKKLLRLARPKISVITAIGNTPVHIEFYENAENVAREKFRLVDALPASGYAVLNFDDEMVMDLVEEKPKTQTVTFGFGEGADVKIFNFENRSDESRPEGIFFKIQHKGNVIPVTIKNVFGKAQAYGVAAAFAVGTIYNLNLVEIAELIERYYVPEKRRMNLLQGVKETWIIDDSYNASPLAMQEALATLKDLKAGRKIAVLGDMLELGQYSVEAHEQIGKIAGDAADILITVGPRGKFIAEKAKESDKDKWKENGNIFSFDIADEALAPIQAMIQKGDLILIKASRGIGLDKVVDEIKKM